MNFTKIVALNSIKKLFSEKWQLAMFLIIPLMIGGLFSLITDSDGQAKPVGTLLITDHDESILSQLLVNGFGQGPMAEMFISRAVDKEQAQQLMDDSKASVWLEIDEGFADNFLNERPTTIKLVKNPSQTILPQIAETAVGVMADGGHYIQLLFANELKQFNDLLAGKEVSDLQMAAMSVQIKNTVEGLEKQLFPPQIKAVKQQAEVKQKGSQKSFMLYMFPGILFMSLLFSSQGLAQEFWNDKTQGIVSRLLSSPSGLTQYLNGKIIGSVFVYILIALVIGLMGLILLKLPLAKIIVIIGWLILSGLVLFSLMLFICLLMPNKKAASVVTSAMVFPMMMLGGSFFPFDAMPKWMAVIGQYLPNGFLLDKFNNWFIDDGALSVLYVPAIIAIVFIALFWIINKTLLPKFAKA